ncbi:NLR family CARD domain-containing protein 3 [Genypterus blacodes]|uniref:NLR family CARD domain-containing protein 3 n=1 Tax=Genypterus blacodes TaxID=154954 RepID=UPI003F76DC9C
MMDDYAVESMPSGSGSFGNGVSAGGHQAGGYIEDDEDEDLYYIPERRPSLDLGPEPGAMDTSHWYYVDQALAPAESYSSMITEESEGMLDEDGTSTNICLERTDSYSSCYSLDSDDCEKRTHKVRSTDEDVSKLPDRPELVQDPNATRHPSVTVAFTFKAICKTLEKLSEEDMQAFKGFLWKYYPKWFNAPAQSLDLVDLVDRLLESCGLEVSMQITKALLGEMERSRLVDYLQTLGRRNEVRYNLCVTLRRKYGNGCEDGGTHEDRKHIDSVFANLYITSPCDNGPNTEHEVRDIGRLDTNRAQEKLISHTGILSPKMMETFHTSLALTTGMAGTGKSTAVRKVIMDWVEERSHQHVSFLFPVPFRELKAFEGSNVSLLDIIQTLYPETKQLRLEDYKCNDGSVMFIFDGLDEYKEKLDFHDTQLLSDHTEATSLRVMVVNLLRGRLLYGGLFWITTRPQSQRCVPWDTAYAELELRGFRDADKEEYFRKRFEDPNQAARVLSHLGSCKTLHIMCHLPLFCAVLSDEFQRAFEERGPQAELPGSITHVYTKLLLTLVRSRKFRASDGDSHRESDFLMKLGKLALNMLEQGRVKILKSDWKESGLNTEEAVVNSGFCTQFITEPMVLYHEEVICFLHSTVQEYMAAFYVFLSFRSSGKNLLGQNGNLWRKFKGPKVMELYQSAVERSLVCQDGQLDIFLRFLVGMALEANQRLLEPFCTSSVKWSPVAHDIATLIRGKMGENQHPDRNANLQLCLEELQAALDRR